MEINILTKDIGKGLLGNLEIDGCLLWFLASLITILGNTKRFFIKMRINYRKYQINSCNSLVLTTNYSNEFFGGSKNDYKY